MSNNAYNLRQPLLNNEGDFIIDNPENTVSINDSMNESSMYKNNAHMSWGNDTTEECIVSHLETFPKGSDLSHTTDCILPIYNLHQDASLLVTPTHNINNNNVFDKTTHDTIPVVNFNSNSCMLVHISNDHDTCIIKTDLKIRILYVKMIIILILILILVIILVNVI